MAMRRAVTLLAISGIIAVSNGTAHAHARDPHLGGEDGRSRSPTILPDYALPAPGSYRLPPIRQAHDGKVIDADGAEHSLFELMEGHYVLLSFIYTGCYDPRGCPLAIYALNAVREELDDDPATSGKVLLLTVSFDPENDTPEVMREFAEARGFGEERSRREWRFLTTSSKAGLQPILDGYGQYVVRETGEDGRPSGAYSHVLKVFLIDPDRNVRNIYSTGFLYPELILNDIRTLIGEEESGVR